MRAEARDQVRHAAAQWLTGDRTAALGQQMVLSITRYRQANQRSPTWAEALAGVDPALREPITTVPDGWPLAPAVWRRELRQRLMGELKHARWVTYTRTPRSLHPRRRRPRLAQHHEPTTRRAAPAGHRPVARTRAAVPARHLGTGHVHRADQWWGPGGARRPRPPDRSAG